MATRNAISVAEKDKERRLQEFEEEAVSRTTSSEQLDDGSITTTNMTVSTQKSKGMWVHVVLLPLVFLSEFSKLVH